MEKTEYIKPKVKVHDIQIECMLSVSNGNSLPDTGYGGNGSGQEADVNSNVWSDTLWL